MKTLAYTGLKLDGERAFLEQTGIEWFPGDKKPVEDAIAAEMLKHPTIWCEVPAKQVSKAQPALKEAARPVATGSASETEPDETSTDVLPPWAKKGIEVGATDEQLQAIAAAGGPETEEGAALWKDATGTDWTPEQAVTQEQNAAPVKPAAKAAKKAPAKKTAAKKTAKKAK